MKIQNEEKIVEIEKLDRENSYQGVAGWWRWQNTTTFYLIYGIYIQKTNQNSKQVENDIKTKNLKFKMLRK